MCFIMCRPLILVPFVTMILLVSCVLFGRMLKKYRCDNQQIKRLDVILNIVQSHLNSL